MSYNKETGLYEGYIYKIYNDINDKLYIGQTMTTIPVRWRNHKTETKAHTNTDKVHNAMKKHGIENFHIKPIEKYVAETKEALVEILDEKEKYYIEQYNTYYEGYNSTKGGRDGVDHQKRPVIKYSLYGKEIARYESIEELKTEFETVNTIYACCLHNSKYAYGHIWRYEDDTKDIPILSEKEIKEATIRYLTLKPIDMYDYKGNKIKTYKNINDVLVNEIFSRKQIINVCSGKAVYAGTNIFRFSCDSFDTYRTYREKPKLVEQYDLNGNFIQVFESAREAARSIGSNGTIVSNVCNGHQKTAGGYMWKYVEDVKSLPDLKHNMHCKKVYQYTKEGQLINTFMSIKEASETTKLNSVAISNQAYGNTKSLGEYVFSFVELSQKDIQNRTQSKLCKAVYQYTINGEYIARYNSLKEAGKTIDNSINAARFIGNCCRKIKKTAYGYKWFFENDEARPAI